MQENRSLCHRVKSYNDKINQLKISSKDKETIYKKMELRNTNSNKSEND